MPLHNFLLMNMYSILKSHTSLIAYKKLFLNCFKTFPILNCWSSNSDNVLSSTPCMSNVSYSNITVNPLKFDFGKNLQAKCRIVKIKYR